MFDYLSNGEEESSNRLNPTIAHKNKGSRRAEAFAQLKLEDRCNIYKFLSGLYLQAVSKVMLEKIADPDFLQELSECLGEKNISILENCLSNKRLNDKDLVQMAATLKQEYMNLFAVPTGSYVAPYEDIYLGKTQDGRTFHGPLLGVRAIAVKKLYREAGAQVDQLCNELPNHIGIELSFMQFLCEQEMHSLRAEYSMKNNEDEIKQSEVYRRFQFRFLKEHLTNWFPLLNEAINSKSKVAFYRSWSNFTELFLLRDKEQLEQQYS